MLSSATKRTLRSLAVATAVGMFLVLVMGAAVTNTGSAEGCGRSWPLCNGQLVPEFTVATAIEYSHRGVTGLESVLVAVLSAMVVWTWRRDRELRLLVIVMFGTLLLQAGLGAGAVLVPQSPVMLATHFGVSLICFAATFLIAQAIFERTGTAQRGRLVLPSGVHTSIRAITVYVLLVVYLGAYIRHAGISLACADWPLCNGQVVPALAGPTVVVFAHRLAALGATAALGWLVWRVRGLASASSAARLAFALVVLQVGSGAAVVLTRLGLFSTLGHAAIMALLCAALASLVRLTVRSSSAAEDVHGWLDQAEGHAQGGVFTFDRAHHEP